MLVAVCARLPAQGVLTCCLDFIHGRLAVAPFEPSEELRFQLIVFLGSLLPQSVEALEKGLDKVVDILAHAVRDTYPEVKKAGCDVIGVLAPAAQASGVTLDARTKAFAKLVKACTPALKHQHRTVRQASLAAISTLCVHSPARALLSAVRDALPAVVSLAFDRAPKLRELVLDALAGEFRGSFYVVSNFDSAFFFFFFRVLARLAAGAKTHRGRPGWAGARAVGSAVR